MEKTLEKAAKESLARQIESCGFTTNDLNALYQAGIIPKGTPPTQIYLFAKVCAERELSPFTQQIHLVRRYTKNGASYSYQTAIDGLRTIAGRTGQYAGNDDYRFDENLNEYEMIKAGKLRPETATATVYKMIGGVRCPFSATVRWSEYYPGEKQGFMWRKMPFLMAGKCAEALALRKAFPDQLGKIYVEEEMQQDIKEQEQPAEVVIETAGKQPVEVNPEIKSEKLNAEDYIKIIESYKTLNQLHSFKEKNAKDIKAFSKAGKDKIGRCYNKKEKEITNKLLKKEEV